MERNILTIRQTIKRAKEDGLYISEAALRKLVANNQIAHFTVGDRAYIYYKNFCDYVTRGGTTDGWSA